jgi:hypothetical protein
MQANELRLGNLIIGNLIYEGKLKTFRRLNDDLDVVFFSDGSIHEIGEYLTDCKPIPLTEEWLLKFGFVSNPYKDRYELIAKINIIIECDKTKGLVNLYCEQFPHIKYVHQLQNLYFALTGEELTIKQQEQ